MEMAIYSKQEVSVVAFHAVSGSWVHMPETAAQRSHCCSRGSERCSCPTWTGEWGTLKESEDQMDSAACIGTWVPQYCSRIHPGVLRNFHLYLVFHG